MADALMTKSAQRRHEAFWKRGDADRPLWGVGSGVYINDIYPRAMAKIRPGRVRPEDIPVDEVVRDCEERYTRYQGMGDLPFTCGPFSGIPWLEAMCGCPMMSSPTSFWAEPCCDRIEDWHPSSPARETPWGRKLLELAAALAGNAGGRYQVSPALMRGPLDIVVAVRGAAGLVLDLVDSPGAVDAALDAAAGIWEDIGRAQLELLPASDQGYVALEGGLRVWAPDRLLWLQEDAMAFLSPDLYRRHVLPLDRRLSEAIPCVAFHLHGSALWAIDELVCVPGIDVLELNLEDARCDVEGTFAGWRKIQDHKPLVIWRKYDRDFDPWLDRVLGELRPGGLSIQVAAANPAEAREAAAILRRRLERGKE